MICDDILTEEAASYSKPHIQHRAYLSNKQSHFRFLKHGLAEMQAYTELAAPSAVTHSLSLPLTSPSASNLVVAKGSLLQIFATRAISAELDPQSQKGKQLRYRCAIG